jgi:hypothetical protein
MYLYEKELACSGEKIRSLAFPLWTGVTTLQFETGCQVYQGEKGSGL